MLHEEFNNGLRAYPIHQAVQAMGSTAQAVVGGVVVRAQPMGNLVLSQDRTQELSLDGVFEDGDLNES
jgi:hypothetical protein